MQPKFLIFKFYSSNLYEKFIQKISQCPCIFFYSKKYNGTYNVVVKTQKYFNEILKSNNTNSKFYTSYIYLYTSISIALSELIIENFELKFAHQILDSKYKYLTSPTKTK